MGDEPFWSVSSDELLRQLHTSQDGLSSEAARERYIAGARSRLKPHHDISVCSSCCHNFEARLF